MIWFWQVPENINVTCAIPVNLRKAGEEVKELGNKFGFLTCQLPLYSFDSPLERLKTVGRRMSTAKKLPVYIYNIYIYIYIVFGWHV
jgi:hypothetical protein